MRVIRLAALIATAQVALVVILFTFGYSIAHASVLYSQPIHDGIGENGGNFSSGFITGEHNLVPSASGHVSSLVFWPDIGFYSCQWFDAPSSHGVSFQFSTDGYASTYTGSGTPRSDGSCIALLTSGAGVTLTSGTPVQMIFGANYFSKYSFLGSVGSTGTSHAAKFTGAYAYSSDQSAISNYSVILYTDTTPPALPPSNGLAFQTLLPETGTTTPTTSVEFKAMYYVASTTIEATAGHGAFGLGTTAYSIKLTRLDVASTSSYVVGYGAGNDQWNTLDTTITLAASSTWQGVWTSYDAASDYPTYQRSAYFNFSVQSNTLLSSLGIAGYDQIPSLSSASTTAIAPAPCNITNLSGCFQNALVFLFYPSTASLDQFGNLWTLVKNKPPFGYVVAVQTAVSTLSANNTATFNLGTVPFMSAIFDPFRTAVAVLMWLVFIVAFYHRLSTLDI